MESEARPGGYTLYAGLHDVAETPDAQADELRSWVPFSWVRPKLDAIVANCRHRHMPLHITSDDGFRSDYEVLAPWVLNHGLKASFFIVTDFLDRPGRLTSAQVRELHSMGIKIGAHGDQHINWIQASPSEFSRDIAVGKDRLEQLLGESVDSVAIPFGAYDGRVFRHLRKIGFTDIHSSRPGFAWAGTGLKPRNMLTREQADDLVALSERAAGLRDAGKCFLRQMRVSLPLVAS